MKGYILGMLAETPVHPGAGQVYSVIDLPGRPGENHRSPTIPGSGLKGALREKWLEEKGEKGLEDLFGKQDHAGAFGVADARLLLLPRPFLDRALPLGDKPLFTETVLPGYENGRGVG